MKKKRIRRACALSVSAITDDILVATLEKYDVVTRKVCMHWCQIAGKVLSDLTYPARVLFYDNTKVDGTLVIEISNPGFALQLQSYEKIIVSRVNSYFGYSAISKIKLQVVKQIHGH